jgi:hypothetical protein
VQSGTYVLPDATSLVTGGIRLTGDLGGTAVSPTVPGLASRSGTGACGANTWASTLNGAAAPTCTQPAFSNLSGSATAAQIPAASTTLGGVKMAASCGAGTHVNAIGVGGELGCTADSGVVSVSASAPIASSGGANPNITISSSPTFATSVTTPLVNVGTGGVSINTTTGGAGQYWAQGPPATAVAPLQNSAPVNFQPSGWSTADTTFYTTDFPLRFVPTSRTALTGAITAGKWSFVAGGAEVASVSTAGVFSPSASGAPTTATYITQTADAGLSAEQALSSLSTGIVKVTTGTGVLSTAVAGDFPALAYLPVAGAAASANLINGAVVTVANHTATGTPSATTYYRGDNTWSTPSGGGGGVGTLTRLTATWASSATANTLGIVGAAGVPMTSPTYAAAAPYSGLCHILMTRPSAVNQPRYGIQSSGTVTTANTNAVIGLAGTLPARTEALQSTNALATAGCAAGCTANVVTGGAARVFVDTIEIAGVMNATGTISLIMAPSAAAAHTAQIGSYCVWY